MKALKNYKFLIAMGAILVFNYYILSHHLPLLIIIDLTSIVILLMIIAQLKGAQISDNLLLILAGLGACYSYFSENEILSLIIFPFFNFAIALTMLFISKIALDKQLIGQSEIKILFICGLFLSIENIAVFYLITCFFGILMAIYWRRYRMGIYYSFGLPISISLYFCALFGKNLDLTFLAF